jgi:hypothetical protein
MAAAVNQGYGVVWTDAENVEQGIGLSSRRSQLMMKHHTVRANGIRQHYLEAGEGAPVILLHGFPETSFAWRYQIPELANLRCEISALSPINSRLARALNDGS